MMWRKQFALILIAVSELDLDIFIQYICFGVSTKI